jgi:membrane fusion protein, multidrug efflux system
VLTVGEDSKVVAKPVTLGGIALGLRVIASGLSPTDRVVIAGVANPFVRPGVTVAARQGEIHPSDGQIAAE